ncbi:response regulator [Bdellovibrio sp.]|uniref:response regulator n=1 Tax=Bdellovibrio sp. TaxID=28201 RepID=UPI0039E3ECB5
MINILIVDDEADTHLLYKLKFKKLFANLGELNLVSFLNAPDCLKYLERSDVPPVDLILSDINMPDMDGFELLQKVHEKKPQLPFYMVSAYESPEFRIKADSLGATRFLSKPVDFHLLGDMLKKDLSIQA